MRLLILVFVIGPDLTRKKRGQKTKSILLSCLPKWLEKGRRSWLRLRFQIDIRSMDAVADSYHFFAMETARSQTYRRACLTFSAKPIARGRALKTSLPTSMPCSAGVPIQTVLERIGNARPSG